MGEFSAPGAYEVLTASMQNDRLFNVDLSSGLGRKPTAVPSHLSRVLYVPSHSMLNLSLYDVTTQYQTAIDHCPVGGEHVLGKALMGSRLYKTRLNTMKRPAGDGRDGQVEYLVDLDVEKIRDGGEISATVQRRQEDGPAPEVTIVLPMLTDYFSLVSTLAGSKIDVSTTHPLPSLNTHVGAIRFPYFRFSLPNDPRVYEWQMHPLEHGTLRYTLVEMDSAAAGGEAQQDVDKLVDKTRAIYHHVGHDGSLFLPHSEGVLLLPELDSESEPLLEAVIVSSLIALLWRIRGMEIKEKKPEVSKRRSLVRRVFGRKA